MQGTGPAIGDHREVARIQTAFGSDRLDRMGHGGDGDAENTLRRFHRTETERIGDLVEDRSLGCRNVELHFTAEETIRRQTAEQDIGIGDGRLGTALTVTGRAGLCARTLGADAQTAFIGNPRDRPTTGADFENIHHRDLYRQRAFVSADQGAAGGKCFAMMDHAGFCRRAPHVEGDGIFHPQHIA